MLLCQFNAYKQKQNKKTKQQNNKTKQNKTTKQQNNKTKQNKKPLWFFFQQP